MASITFRPDDETEMLLKKALAVSKQSQSEICRVALSEWLKKNRTPDAIIGAIINGVKARK